MYYYIYTELFVKSSFDLKSIQLLKKKKENEGEVKNILTSKQLNG